MIETLSFNLSVRAHLCNVSAVWYLQSTNKTAEMGLLKSEDSKTINVRGRKTLRDNPTQSLHLTVKKREVQKEKGILVRWLNWPRKPNLMISGPKVLLQALVVRVEGICK